MKNGLTPLQAYRKVEKIALKNNMSISAWAEKRGVRKSTVSHWKCKPQRTVLVSTLERLGVSL